MARDEANVQQQEIESEAAAKIATAQTGQNFVFTVNGGKPVDQAAP